MSGHLPLMPHLTDRRSAEYMLSYVLVNILKVKPTEYKSSERGSDKSLHLIL